MVSATIDGRLAGDDPTTSLRRVLGCFPTGVALLCTDDAGRPRAMTASALASMSLQPPIIVIGVAAAAATCGVIRRTNSFVVNILATEQVALARRFAGPHRELADPFSDVTWRRGLTGAPIIGGCLAWLECRVEASVVVGDHVAFFATVLAHRLASDQAPLVHVRGRFRELGAPILTRVPPWFEDGVSMTDPPPELQDLRDPLGRW